MIFGFLRLAIVGFLVLSVVYLLVSWYSRSVRREWLEKRFDEGDITGERDTYVALGMLEYQQGLRRKLLILVYVIPTIVIVGIVYILNFS